MKAVFNYFKKSFQRKMARRFTREYPAVESTFCLYHEGQIDFVNWCNPLVHPIRIQQSTVDFFKEFISPGDLVIDIGANIGDTTVPMALAAGGDGLTLAFDPNPYAFKILEKNAMLNPGKQNIVPLRFAISVEEQDFYFVSSEASFANGGISATRRSEHGKYVYPEMIRGINLLDFLDKNYPGKVNRLTFIKIDTEGYDKEIIKSIRTLIQRNRPVLIAECFGASTDTEKLELYDVISSLQYDIFYFDDFDAGTRRTRLEHRTEIKKFTSTINIYAVPRKLI